MDARPCAAWEEEQGPQTAFGIRLFATQGEKIGLAAGIGSDFPEPCLHWLNRTNIDTSGLIPWPHPTLRAWQVFEENGLRTQIWRVPMVDDMLYMLRPSFQSLPLNYQNSKSYHICVHPSTRDVDFIYQLKNSKPLTVSVEPYTRADSILTRAELQALISAGDIFSPNEDEAFSLVGPGPPLDVIDRMAELGGKFRIAHLLFHYFPTQIICLRRGPLGCVVQNCVTKETWEIPAFYSVFGSMSKEELLSIVSHSTFSMNDATKPSTVTSFKEKPTFPSHPNSRKSLTTKPAVELLGIKDVTGCGNTFCGGFLSGWVQTNDILHSALCGSVAASFMLEYDGVPEPSFHFPDEAKIRLKMLRSYAKKIPVPT